MNIAFCQSILIFLTSFRPVQLAFTFPNNGQKQPTNFQTYIILGNQYTSKAEIYEIFFRCTSYGCQPLPLEDNDLVWSSPDTKGISEVKYVFYNRRAGVLCTTQNGAIIYEYPTGTVLFHKELESSFYINVHSAEVLPDGNVVVAGSMSNGIFAVLYPDGDNVNQAISQTVTAKAPFGHGVVYDNKRKRLYAGGYLTLLALEYSSGSNKRGAFKVVRNISLASIYDEPNKNENAAFEDGVHDLYPIDGSSDTLFLTTGEHVFTINVESFTIGRFQNLYTVSSKNSNTKQVAVKGKGGVKVVSYDYNSGAVFAKPSPWFKEWMTTSDQNYSPYEPVLVWTMPNKGFCPTADYDITDNCKIDFDELEPIWFYKARVFTIPWPFSY